MNILKKSLAAIIFFASNAHAYCIAHVDNVNSKHEFASSVIELLRTVELTETNLQHGLKNQTVSGHPIKLAATKAQISEYECQRNKFKFFKNTEKASIMNSLLLVDDFLNFKINWDQRLLFLLKNPSIDMNRMDDEVSELIILNSDYSKKFIRLCLSTNLVLQYEGSDRGESSKNSPAMPYVLGINKSEMKSLRDKIRYLIENSNDNEILLCSSMIVEQLSDSGKFKAMDEVR
jgi:hypothetical protein